MGGAWEVGSSCSWLYEHGFLVYSKKLMFDFPILLILLGKFKTVPLELQTKVFENNQAS